MFKNYKTGELFNYIGVTRDTLRFYEKKGLLSPQKDSENNYRNYDIYDVYKIMIIDFYKKRGFTIQQIQSVLKEMKGKDIEENLDKTIGELQQSILMQQRMLDRIIKTRDFSLSIEKYLDTFTIKTMPGYKIVNEISDFIAIEEYADIIEFNDMDDMLSKIMRHISFDDTGVIDTSMYIVEPSQACADQASNIGNKKCLYTVVLEQVTKGKQNADIMQDMYNRTKNYATQNNLKCDGHAFAIIRYVTCEENKINAYIEIYVPCK